jgi:hypothetical protein
LTKKYLQFAAILLGSALLFPISALARDNAHSIEFTDMVKIGSTQLKPGSYKVEWQGTGSAVQVSFLRNGKTVATVPGTLKMNDNQVREDSVLTETTSADSSVLQEIDFGHEKEALVFNQGM